MSDFKKKTFWIIFSELSLFKSVDTIHVNKDYLRKIKFPYQGLKKKWKDCKAYDKEMSFFFNVLITNQPRPTMCALKDIVDVMP